VIAFQKSLTVGKTDRYSVDLENWLDSQVVIDSTISSVGALTTESATTISGSIVSWLITGVTSGVETYDINYSTATRSDCIKVQLRVEAC